MAETGEEFAVPVDDRLRAALRGDRARLGQLEIQMESALRPRDIQARIRAGESPEAVAAVAQMPMERVMAFAGPVLAERDHIATLAQRASVRRRGGGDAPTRNLGAWVTDRLRLRHVDPASAEWDAWRREDGRWAVRVSYFVESEDSEDSGEEQKDEKVGMFAYDAPGRYVVPDDDEARWLVGEQAQVLPTPVQPQPGERRLAAVADIDPLIAPDHGADSYEAGFEDTVALRRRNHPVSRDDTQGHQREVSRTSHDTDRGPRRVHSVPNPDEEPTLIDVPVDQPPAPRPSVRAVERPTPPPTYASPADPHRDDDSVDDLGDEPSALNTRDSRSTRGFHDESARDFRDEQPGRGLPDDRSARNRPAGSRQEQAPSARATPSRTPETQRAEPSRPTGPRPTAPRPADPRPEQSARSGEQRPSEDRRPAPDRASEDNQPEYTQSARAEQPPGDARTESARPSKPATTPEQPALPEGADNTQATDPPAEPKKKPARRGKRASVPSWDEIMFGKKAD
ncbi:hypothetical protein JOF29_004009 [Kribbella aluminosa]|uniref:DUF3071 domain-containing protein n=2 Tax=Kribbella aluminosa TaxID=416017 RepID=A0ABS4UMR2_9ACTN|nr:hypothetical protein [Kribbella aluminosa]